MMDKANEITMMICIMMICHGSRAPFCCPICSFLHATHANIYPYPYNNNGLTTRNVKIYPTVKQSLHSYPIPNKMTDDISKMSISELIIVQITPKAFDAMHMVPYFKSLCKNYIRSIRLLMKF